METVLALLYDLTLLLFILSCLGYFLSQSLTDGGKFGAIGFYLLLTGMVFEGALFSFHVVTQPMITMHGTSDVLIVLSLLIALIYIVLELKFAIHYAGPIVMLLLITIVSYASLFDGKMSPVLFFMGDIHWRFTLFALHAIAFLAFAVAFVSAVIRLSAGKAALIEELVIYRAVLFGFPFLGICAIMRAVWMNEKGNGSYFAGSFDDIVFLLPAFLYFLYLHFAFVHRWKGIFMSWLAIVGFASLTLAALNEYRII